MFRVAKLEGSKIHIILVKKIDAIILLAPKSTLTNFIFFNTLAPYLISEAPYQVPEAPYQIP